MWWLVYGVERENKDLFCMIHYQLVKSRSMYYIFSFFNPHSMAFAIFAKNPDTFLYWSCSDFATARSLFLSLQMVGAITTVIKAFLRFV